MANGELVYLGERNFLSTMEPTRFELYRCETNNLDSMVMKKSRLQICSRNIFHIVNKMVMVKNKDTLIRLIVKVGLTCKHAYQSRSEALIDVVEAQKK